MISKAQERTTQALLALRRTVLREREQELERAMEYRKLNQPVKAAYHTGLADGRNRIADALESIAYGGSPQWTREN